MRDLADELLQAKVKARLFGGEPVTRLGRLLLIERVGHGAMGSVFAAYDPELDRKVAVKALHPEAPARARERFLSEARALARVDHANVITVHDVAESDGTGYVVLELVRGESLAVWSRQARPWRQVVEVIRSAGDGLAAAHRAGVIHRDVKPANIVVGRDRVRLVDFGLAEFTEPVTHDGAGTPSYMAPELTGGEGATHASDQYALGLCLLEALNGQRVSRDAKPIRRYPPWLHALGLRMTARDAGDRFPSVEAACDALAARARRRLWVGGGVAAAALVGGLVAYALTGHPTQPATDPCSVASDSPTATWGDRRAAIARALGDAPWAITTLTTLDRYRDAWQTSYRRVCEATRVTGAQSDRLLEVRMSCLARTQSRWAALVTSLGELRGSAARVSAAEAVVDLPRPEPCERVVSDVEPSDPDTRVALDRAWVSVALGRYADARGQLAAVTPNHDGELAEHATLVAAVEGRIGQPQNARRALDRALIAAATARRFDLEHQVWTHLLRHELFAGDPDRAIEWAPFARAAAARGQLAGAEVDGLVGEALRRRGRLDEARQLIDRALASTDPLRADQRAILEMNRGAIDLARGHAATARAAFARGLALTTDAFGARHPATCLYHDKLGEAARARGELRSALSHHDASVAIRTAAFGERDRAVATARFHRAETELEAGLIKRAREDLAITQSIREQVYGPTNPRLAEGAWLAAELADAAGDERTARSERSRATTLDPKLAMLPSGTIDHAIGEAHAITSNPAGEVGDRAHALAAVWSAAGTVDAAWSVAVGDALRAIGETDQALIAYRSAERIHADEPSLTRLRAVRGIAATTGDPHETAAMRERAHALERAMPELAAAH